MKSFLQNNNIEMYSTHNEGKSVVSEKCIRTLKNKMWIASAESRSVRGASHQPVFMGDCRTICQTCLLCLPSKWVSFCVPGAIEVSEDATRA